VSVFWPKYAAWFQGYVRESRQTPRAVGGLGVYHEFFVVYDDGDFCWESGGRKYSIVEKLRSDADDQMSEGGESTRSGRRCRAER